MGDGTETIGANQHIHCSDYHILESRIAKLEALAIDMLGSAGFALWESEKLCVVKSYQERITALEAEVHRARTDSRYWDEFNTISAHDATRNKNDYLEQRNRALAARCTELKHLLHGFLTPEDLKLYLKQALKEAEP